MPVLRMLAAALLTSLALTLGGCSLNPRADESPAAPLLAPATEAIGYLPPDSELVALIDTAPRGNQWAAAAPGLRRAGLGDALDRAQQELAAVGLDSVAGRALLGNRMALALPHADHPRGAVAALVVRDPDLLDVLVGARVQAGLFAPAGIHREAHLFRGHGLAIATRGTLLLIAPDVPALRAALDRRTANTGYSPRDFKVAVAGLPARALVRVALDPSPLIRRAGGAIRSIPWLSALDRVGASLAVEQDKLVLRVNGRTSGDELADADSPLPARAAAPPVGIASAAPGLTIALADLPHLALFAYRSAFAAHPTLIARAEAATLVVRGRHRIDPPRALLAALRGPATVVVRDGRTLLRAPIALGEDEHARIALGRWSARLPRMLAALGVPDPHVEPLDGLVAVERGSHVLASFGLVGSTVVVGNAPAETLRAFAAAGERPVTWAHGPLALSLDGAALNSLLTGRLADLGIAAEPMLGRAHLWARATARQVELELRLPL